MRDSIHGSRDIRSNLLTPNPTPYTGSNVSNIDLLRFKVGQKQTDVLDTRIGCEIWKVKLWYTISIPLLELQINIPLPSRSLLYKQTEIQDTVVPDIHKTNVISYQESCVTHELFVNLVLRHGSFYYSFVKITNPFVPLYRFL